MHVFPDGETQNYSIWGNSNSSGDYTHYKQILLVEKYMI